VAQEQPQAPQQGIAHVPATVLTVEYVNDNDAMNTALKALEQRMQKLEVRINDLQDKQARVIGAVNQQAKDMGHYLESVGRRIDLIFKRVMNANLGSNHGDQSVATVEIEEASQETVMIDMDLKPIDPAPEPEPAPAPEPANASITLSPTVADDEEHRNAWRIARVLTADLEAYHEDTVREGVIYGTFYKLLRDPIDKARETYEQRVSDEIVENFDYFSKAIDELIARKRMELEAGT
jgi:hypothetical protein